MKRVVVLFLIFMLGFATCSYATQNNFLKKSKEVKLEKKIQFKSVKLTKILNYLSKQTGINLTAKSKIKNKKISLNFATGSSLKEIIDFLKAQYNLDYTVNNKQIVFSLPKNRVKSKTKGVTISNSNMVAKASSRVNDFNTEEYQKIRANQFLSTLDNPLSTFSIDVDTAAYSNIRRFINHEQLPPKDVVRIEELINYFNYDYPAPKGQEPFSIATEVADCPWNTNHQLAMIGLQGKKVKTKNLPPNNLVFLVDASGSMQSANKLPLLKKSLKLLVKQLRAKDRVSLVVYAGSSTVLLDSTAGDNKSKIIAAIERLGARGSTAGSAGIKTAYKIAKQNFIADGNNRVLLATDGDFNVGVSSTGALVRLIEKKREQGVFLTTLGFGTGNYKGSRMEELSNHGNGNYAYIDNLLEAKKVLINEIGGTLLTIAKDVKIQVEFNPAQIAEYRLIGYENRKLADQNFADDTKDAGELGAGHSVTALYELVPTNKQESKAETNLKYQKQKIKDDAYQSQELMTVKLRYKEPQAQESKLITKPVVEQDITLATASNNYKFASAVAEFAMLLRDSDFKADSSYQEVLDLAKAAKGRDENGYRAEFIKLVELTELILKTEE